MRNLGIAIGLFTTFALASCGDNVNVPPNAPNFVFTTLEDMPVRITLELTDDNGDLVSYAFTTSPVSGILDPQEDIYTPDRDFNGQDQFEYAASDGASQATGTITIVIEAQNDAPGISSVADLTMTLEAPLLIPFGVDDVDSVVDDLRTAAASSNVSVVPTENLVLGGSSINRDVTITAAARGETVISLFVLDDTDISGEQFDLTVLNVPPVAVIDSYNVPTGAQFVVDVATGVLDNDTDFENDPLTATAQATAATTLAGTVTLATDGSFTYDEPAGGIPGQIDTFTYEIADGTDTAMATVSLVVQ